MSCKDPSIAEAIGTGIADGAVDGFDKWPQPSQG